MWSTFIRLARPFWSESVCLSVVDVSCSVPWTMASHLFSLELILFVCRISLTGSLLFTYFSSDFCISISLFSYWAITLSSSFNLFSFLQSLIFKNFLLHSKYCFIEFCFMDAIASLTFLKILILVFWNCLSLKESSNFFFFLFFPSKCVSLSNFHFRFFSQLSGCIDRYIDIDDIDRYIYIQCTHPDKLQNYLEALSTWLGLVNYGVYCRES